MGQVQFEGMEQNFRQEQLKLICVSDTVKFFVFEGPIFKSKNQKGSAKKEDDKTELLDGKKEAEEKAKNEKVLYVFKLENSFSYMMQE